MIDFKCPFCKTAISVPDSLAGMEHKCSNPDCIMSLKVPTVDEAIDRQLLDEQRVETENLPGFMMQGFLHVCGVLALIACGVFLIDAFMCLNGKEGYAPTIFMVAASCFVSAVSFFFASVVLKNLMRITKAVEDRKS